MDAPQSIGKGQTISAPHMHAHALEEVLPALLKASLTAPKRELKILDVGKILTFFIINVYILSSFCHSLQVQSSNHTVHILGCGSGFLTAAFGRLVNRNGPISPLSTGKVFGIEVFPDLVELSRNNIMKQDKDLFDSGTVDISRGDGWKGKPDEAPYDAIHVGAAAVSFPTRLMMQLNPEGGVMVIPVGPDGGVQNLYKVERLRDNDDFSEQDFQIKALLGVRYVPLIQLKP